MGQKAPTILAVAPESEGRRALARWLGTEAILATFLAAGVEWVEALIEQTQGALAAQPDPCLVMGDYKEDNVVVEVGSDGIWRVVGVFDLMGCWFGDGEAELAIQIIEDLSIDLLLFVGR